MPHAYTEDRLVEQPAIKLFTEIDWARVSAFQNLHQTLDLLLPNLLTGQVTQE
jgi:hypothetical protein